MKIARKTYRDIPFSHRQHNHKGHCQYIHGHNWEFEFEFGSESVDDNGFVVDFGKLKWLKEWIDGLFDHKLVLNEDDPALRYMRDTLELNELAEIITLPDASSEGLAQFLWFRVSEMLFDAEAGRVQLLQVTVREDSRNSATYIPELVDVQNQYAHDTGVRVTIVDVGNGLHIIMPEQVFYEDTNDQ